MCIMSQQDFHIRWNHYRNQKMNMNFNELTHPRLDRDNFSANGIHGINSIFMVTILTNLQPSPMQLTSASEPRRLSKIDLPCEVRTPHFTGPIVLKLQLH